MKHIVLIFCSVFVVLFLIAPTTSYTSYGPVCPSNFGPSSIYINCAPSRKAHFGTLFGGVKYIITSFETGSFSMAETAIRQDTSLRGAELVISNSKESSYESFNPKTAITKAGIVSLIISIAIHLYLRRRRKTPPSPTSSVRAN